MPNNDIKNKQFSITFDLDWAPDFVIEDCLKTLAQSDVKATFFATHETDLNQEIIRHGHVLGIHPNFSPNSSQGKNIPQIIESCLKVAPEANCMRTHGLLQSGSMLHQVFNNFPQLELDVSLFMHRAPHVQRVSWSYNAVEFDRILYNWGDDAEFSHQRFSSHDDIFFGKITVYDFHPIHIFLNSTNGSEYSQLKDSLAGMALQKVSYERAKKFCNSGIGVRSFFQRVLTSGEQPILLEDIT